MQLLVLLESTDLDHSLQNVLDGWIEGHDLSVSKVLATARNVWITPGEQVDR